MANDEHSDEEQRDSDLDSTLKRPLPVFYAEIKDGNSCPTAANVRLSTYTYIHKCVHRQTHLSCKCRIITVLSEGGKLGCLLKIAILKRFIDVALGNGGKQRAGVSHSFSLLSQNPNSLHCSVEWCVFRYVVRMEEAVGRHATRHPNL